MPIHDKIIDVSLVALATYLSIRGVTPPHRATKKDYAKADFIREFGLSGDLFIQVFQGAFLALGLVESLAIVSPQSLPKIILAKINPDIWLRQPDVRTVFRIASLVASLGAYGRIVCFRQLGRFFTFDLSVQDKHKVIQSGLYGIVRHPSYTSILVNLAGLMVAKLYGPLFSQYLRSGVTVGASVLFAFNIVVVAARIREEEAMLTSEIGEEYKKYKQNVPKRLIPFLI